MPKTVQGQSVTGAATTGLTVIYENTTSPTGNGFSFNGAETVGSNLGANVDINKLTFASGSAGRVITQLSFQAYSYNTVTVQARPTMYIWAVDGPAGNPGTLLGDFVLPLTSFPANSQTTLPLTLPGIGITVPSSGQVWAGIGFDNGGGASQLTATQLDNLGGLTYHPASVGADSVSAYFFTPSGGSLNNPAVINFASNFTGNYGWTVQIAAGTLAYQNTTSPTGYEFNGAVPVGSNLSANVDINKLTLAPGFTGQAITSVSVLAYNYNPVAVEARPTIYIWAADGAGGNPGSLLGNFVQPLISMGAVSPVLISATLPGNAIVVPSNGQIWAGIGFDNGNAQSTITAALLNNLGAATFGPANVGTDGANTCFLPPGGATLANPTVITFVTNSTANYGWTVQTAAGTAYQNTASPWGYSFNGAANVSGNLVANVDINELTLAAGSAGQMITTVSFLAYNYNKLAVQARPTIYMWLDDGPGGTPGTLQGSYIQGMTSFAASSQATITLTLGSPGFSGGIPVPSDGKIWAGIGFDNGVGASQIAAAQLNNLGGATYHPANIGTDGPNSYFLRPGAASLATPVVVTLENDSSANYGWTVVTASVSACAYSLTPTSLQVPSGGGTYSVSIQTTAGCSWTISGLPSWITASAGTGSGPATITLGVAPNASTSGLSSTIVIAGISVAVSEAGAATQSGGPAITLVVNAEGGGAAIAPNTWVQINGSGLALAGDARVWQGSDFVNNQMPTQLDGVTVTMNGENAYVYYISPSQVNVLTPPDLAPGTVQVMVTNGGTTSAPFTVQALPQSPSFFIFGAGPYVVGTHTNGGDLGPVGLYSGLTTPAHPGELVVLYANGFGAPSSPVVKGLAQQSGTLAVMPTVQIGGVPATVSFAGLISPGLWQFNVTVPPTATNGDNTLTAQYNGQSTQAGVLLTVQSAASISLSAPIVPVGQTVTLAWSSTNASTCGASGSWNGSIAATGTQSVTPTVAGYYTYTLTCTGSGETTTQSVVLTAFGATPTEAGSPNDEFYLATFAVPTSNQITGLQTSLTVPPFPPVPNTPGAALYLWPGLQPATNSVNFQPINNGVLQPVLSWGTSCAPAPASQPKAFSSWWISGQYVNTFGSDPGYTGCLSGNSMLVSPGEVLLLNMELNATTGVWTQTITDSNTKQSVTFGLNMQGQGQNYLNFALESWYNTTINTPVVFSNTTITFQSPDTAGACSISQGKSNSYVMTPPTPVNAGTQCFIGSVVLTQ